MLTIKAAVTKDLAQESRPYGFTRMSRDYSRTTVRMSQEMMATADAHDDKASPLQSRNNLGPGQRR